MKHLNDYSDQRNKSWCIHCGSWINSVDTNRDHVPTKKLLTVPYPRNLPVVQVCCACNDSFSKDEEYFVAFLNSVIVGSTDPTHHKSRPSEKILKRNVALRARIEASRNPSNDQNRIIWNPEHSRIQNVLIKNARGHAYFELGEPLLEDPSNVWFSPLESLEPTQRDKFEFNEDTGLWPEVGSHMLTRVITGADLTEDGWVVVQPNVYRYAVSQVGLMLVKIILYEYLATEVYWQD